MTGEHFTEFGPLNYEVAAEVEKLEVGDVHFPEDIDACELVAPQPQLLQCLHLGVN